MTSESVVRCCVATGMAALVAVALRELMRQSNTQIHRVIVRPEERAGR